VRFVLDSNIVVAALNGVGNVKRRLSALRQSDLGIPIVVFAELLYGAQRSSRKAENLAKIRSLWNALAGLEFTPAVAERYGLTRAELRHRGVPKSDFDLVIACIAIENSATLVTNDHALLDGTIDELRTENWLA
jgi:tRNA(fMet)-specific endonuclease VapC